MLIIEKIKNALRRLYYWCYKIPIAYKTTSKFEILNSLESINYILEKKCSVSRFGDGEFMVMMGEGNGFQKPNALLGQYLKEVLSSSVENHIVAIPYPMKSLDGYVEKSKIFWGPFVAKNKDFLIRNIPFDRIYLDTQLTRFYMMYENKEHCQFQIELLRKIWDGMDIVIVEGELTRSGVGNDLYDNAKSIKRILGPSTNAIDKYDEMFNAILRYAPKDSLILLSYGMVATVLAYELAKKGYWAIDLGHLDVEYEWFKAGVKEKTLIKGKFTNEVAGGEDVCRCENEAYLSQVICCLSK